jgi:phosphoglycolate phosphatase
VPFPGTLNLEIDSAQVDEFANAAEREWIMLVPPDKNFCTSKVLPVSIGTDHSIMGALILPAPDVNIHGPMIIEILSPVQLRKTLSLADGDTVWVAPGRLCVTAALFDLDGTLIDSVESYYRIVEVALVQMGFPVVSRQTILTAAKTDQFNWDLILPDLPSEKKEQALKKAWQTIEALYPEIFLKKVQAFPQTGAVLRQLNDRNIKIGIVTSTPGKNIRDKMAILDREGVSDLIDVVISASDAKRKKPFPDPLFLCCERMGVPPDQCVYIGDMGMDITAGRAAGMKTIGVLTGFETRRDLMENHPDRIIESIADLPGVLHL